MGSLCPGPTHVEQTKSTTNFHKAYHNIAFQNVQGDICNENVDAIVNPSNNLLSHKAGLGSTLVQRGGEVIQEESDRFLEASGEEILNPGTVAVTTAGSLQAKYIIHVVSPIFTGGDHEEFAKLTRGVFNVLEKAEELKISSIALPNLSGGMFGFPRDQGTEMMVKTIFEYIKKYEGSTTLKLIRFVNSSQTEVRLIKQELERIVVDSGKIEEVSSHEGRNIHSSQNSSESEIKKGNTKEASVNDVSADANDLTKPLLTQ